MFQIFCVAAMLVTNFWPHTVFLVLKTILCFYTMRLLDRRTGMALCSSPAPVVVAASWIRVAAAHWLAGSAGGLAGVHRPG